MRKPTALQLKFYESMKKIGLKNCDAETLDWIYAAWLSGYRKGSRSRKVKP